MVRLFSTLLVILVLASPAQALDHWFAYTGGYGALGGDDFEGQQPGPTMGVRYSLRVWSNLYAGIGGDLSAYGFEDFDDDELWQTDANVSLRWYVPIGTWAVFADGYGGYSQYSFRSPFGKIGGRGFMWGAACGVAVPVKGAFIDLSLDANLQDYQNARVGGAEIEDTQFSGHRSLLRASLRIPLGN